MAVMTFPSSDVKKVRRHKLLLEFCGLGSQLSEVLRRLILILGLMYHRYTTIPGLPSRLPASCTPAFSRPPRAQLAASRAARGLTTDSSGSREPNW